MSRYHVKIDQKIWRPLRLKVFERDGYRCVRCGGAGRLECDHVIPLHQNGELYEIGNLQALCRGCHIAKTRGENARRVVAPERARWQALIQSRLD